MGVVKQNGYLTNLNNLFSFQGEITGNIPASVNPTITPVVDINPLANPIVSIVVSSQSFGTIYTTPSNLTFLVSYIAMSCVGNLNIGHLQVTGVINGTTTSLGSLAYSSAAGVAYSTQIQVYPPIQLDPNSIIVFQDINSNSANPYITIYGYPIDLSPTGLNPVNF